MNLFSFLNIEILAILANLEFRYYRNNVNVYIRRQYLRALGVVFENPVSIGTQFYLRNPGLLKIGRNGSFGSFTRIWNYAPIEIGDDFLSAGGLTINCGTHDPLTLEPSVLAVKIGHRVWLGLDVTILGGVTIGDDVVIGAGSVVAKDIPANSVYAGVPAKKIRDLDRSSIGHIWGAWGNIRMPASSPGGQAAPEEPPAG